MIKIVACDMDGTLLRNGAQSISEDQIEVIKKILDKGIIFAAASGRQITSLKRLFEPISDRLMYIAENGALVEYKGKIISKTTMDRQLSLDIINDVYAMENCEVLISGEKTAYMRPKTEEYLYRMTKVINYHTTQISDFNEIKEDIIKIAVCDLSGIKNSEEQIKKKWADKVEVAVSGDLYLDIMTQNVSKGNAMKNIQKVMGLTPDECMAFGDNYNDVELLDQVEESFVMSQAVDDVKKHGKYISEDVTDSLMKYFF